MATTWHRVQDTRTNKILPRPVPAFFLTRFDYLKEVPSSKAAKAAGPQLIEEPTQPGQDAPDSVITEPDAPAAKAKTGRNRKSITEGK